MIKQINKHITQKQINLIVETIVQQYRQYLIWANRNEYKGLFRDEYAKHKKQHNISWAISSAFPSEKKFIEGMEIKCFEYEGGHVRPELYNEKIKMHILSNQTFFQAKYLKKCYAFNTNNFNNKCLYCYIKYSVNNQKMIKLSLCLPDEKGKVIAEEILLDNDQILKLVA